MTGARRNDILKKKKNIVQMISCIRKKFLFFCKKIKSRFSRQEHDNSFGKKLNIVVKTEYYLAYMQTFVVVSFYFIILKKSYLKNKLS